MFGFACTRIKLLKVQVIHNLKNVTGTNLRTSVKIKNLESCSRGYMKL
jgi:hypothetical protein